MKVYIGPYTKWVGVFQIVDFFMKPLKSFGVNEDMRFDVGEWIDGKIPQIHNLLNWVDSKKERNVKVKIDKYDTWNMDHTLSLVIYPLLIRLKEDKHGAPLVDDNDVPEELKSTSAAPKINEWDTDENHFKRYDYVLDEMIWKFKQISECIEVYPGDGPGEMEAYKEHDRRIEEGLRLFGRYFRSLWT